MATAAYNAWVAAGRKYKIARPIADMVALAKANNVTVLGTIGDQAHLTDNFPQDHTPFSQTYWPVQASGWVCACDIANTDGLGYRILTDARAGKAPWLKYINFGGRNYDHSDNFRASSPNSDQHVHLSCRSDWLTQSIAPYTPFGGSPMPTPAVDDYGEYGRPSAIDGPYPRTVPVMVADMWSQELLGVSPYDGVSMSHRSAQLARIERDVLEVRDIVAKLPTSTGAGGSVDVAAFVAAVTAALLPQIRSIVAEERAHIVLKSA